MTMSFLSNFMKIYVKFESDQLDEPQYIGPFDSIEEADDYVDYNNTGLSLNGVPSWVACYSVV